MVVAWGLELNNPIKEVRYEARTLFAKDMLGGLNYILNWSVPSIGLDLFECFEEEDEGKRYGYIPFLRWKVQVDKPSLYKAMKDAWDKMWEELSKIEDGMKLSGEEWTTFPCRKHNPQGWRA